MCQSMVDIQPEAAEIRRGRKKKEEDRKKLECGPMPNVMVALPKLAKHRWRRLFNAAKFGSRPLLNAVQ